MKKYFLVLSLFLSIFTNGYPQNNSKSTVISGYIPQLSDSSGKVLIAFANLFDLENSGAAQQPVKLINGRFTYSVDIKKPLRFSIEINDQRIFLFPFVTHLIEPGDSIHIEVPDIKKMGLGFIYNLNFSGKGSEKLMLIKDVFSTYLKTRVNKPIFKMTLEEEFCSNGFFVKRILDSIAPLYKSVIKKEVLDIINAQYLDATFEFILRRALKDIKSESTISLIRKYIYETNFINNFTKPNVVQNLYLTHKVLNYLAFIDFKMENKALSDVDIMATPILYYSTISEFYKNQRDIRELLLAERIVSFLNTEEFSSEIEYVVRNFLRDFPTGILHEQVRSIYEKTIANKSKGVQFYNFSLPDKNGNIKQLSDFKGKVVLIDFWFTGCVACKMLKPRLEEIEKKHNDQDIIFISISIDKDKQLWEKERHLYSTTNAIMLYTNGEGSQHQLIKYADIKAYPTLFLLDRAGKVFASNFKFSDSDLIMKKVNEAIDLKK